jgi:hypothetical protein
MFKGLTQPLRCLLRQTGFDIVRYRSNAISGTVSQKSDSPITADDAIWSAVAPYTMTSRERVQAAVDAARYVNDYQIPGSIVECGVWRGGSSMAMALALIERGDVSREMFLFDTFEGMPPPTELDKDFHGSPALDQLLSTPKEAAVWCHATLDDVRANMGRTAYPADKLHFIRGQVEQTIPQPELHAPIAILRLDTDWYESTKHELHQLFPMLAPGGVLIIDDYGHWQGARRAVDEFLAAHRDVPLFLNRIDYTGRIAVKLI